MISKRNRIPIIAKLFSPIGNIAKRSQKVNCYAISSLNGAPIKRGTTVQVLKGDKTVEVCTRCIDSVKEAIALGLQEFKQVVNLRAIWRLLMQRSPWVRGDLMANDNNKGT